MRYVPVICAHCEKTYQRDVGHAAEAVRLGRKQFCSKDCQFAYQKTGRLVKCITCGKEIYRINTALANTKNSFCSSSCAATHTNKHRDHSYSKKKKVCNCKYCGRETKVSINASSGDTVCIDCKTKHAYTQNRRCKYIERTPRICKQCESIIKDSNKTGYCGKHYKQSLEYRNSISKKVIEKIKDGTHKGWTTRNILSYPEKYFKELLDNEFPGTFEINYPVTKRSLGLDCDANYFLDFYFPDLKLDLEIDGKQHRYPERVESDRIRDEALQKAGYQVFRIRWYNPGQKDRELLITQIEELKSILHNGH